MTRKNYGWIPDIPDRRDYLYYRIMPVVRLPRKVDLREKGFSPVENQGQLGSCTANALAGNLEYIDVQDGSGYTDQSRLFIYYNERALRGNVKQDSGAMLRDGIKSLVKWGSCPEKTWQYDIELFAKKPPEKAYKAAKKSRIKIYYRLETLDEMKTCIASGFPFVFGFAVYESFESQKVAGDGILDMPKKGERMLGGHAVMAAGFDETKKRFIIRNSWGTDWGQEGYFTMPYEYLGSRDLSDDFWTIRK